MTVQQRAAYTYFVQMARVACVIMCVYIKYFYTSALDAIMTTLQLTYIIPPTGMRLTQERQTCTRLILDAVSEPPAPFPRSAKFELRILPSC